MRLLRICSVAVLMGAVGFAQNFSQLPVAPVLSDPLELVTGGIVVPATSDERLRFHPMSGVYCADRPRNSIFK
jgi:hypothetical protein